MFYPAETIIHVGLYGRSTTYFDKMELIGESQIMTQEERKPIKGIDLQDPSILKDLVKRSREGDIQAMEAIYKHFSRPIFNLAYRYTYNSEIAEDLLQDIFLKIFTHLQEIQKEETFVAWLYRVAINTCYSYLRGRKSQLQRTIPLSKVEGTIEGRTYEFDDEIMKNSLDDAIHILPGKMKSVFLLHDVQGFKHEEIARMLGCSVGTSKSQLFKARMKIREHLENKQVI